MEKRTLVAIILSLAILFIWQAIFRPKHTQISSTSTGSGETTKIVPSEPGAQPDHPQLIESVAKQSLRVKGPAKTIQIETDKMVYVLSEDEASLVHCFLKEEMLKEKTTVDLVLNGKLLNDKNTGQWTYVPQEAALYQVNFIRTIGNFNIEKTFNFDNNSYLVGIKYIVTNMTGVSQSFNGLTLSIGPGLGTDIKGLKDNKRLLRAISYVHKKVEKLDFDDGDSCTFSDKKWAGLDNRYFLSVFLRTKDGFNKVETEKVEKLPVLGITTGKIDFSPNGKKFFSTISYTGPKGYKHLQGIKIDDMNLELEKAIDFGFFSDLGKLAFKVLNYLYKVTKNYGWAIFIISIFLNIIFFPLSKKSFRSAQAMKSVQTDVKALQARYKNDPKKMNTEVWALYKARGVNPFSGCLPMLVQLPIFFALFTMLRNAYELRGAPWIFWITDLSAKDPYYILPIMMGAGMFLQQKMTGAASDPTQKQMMIFMPVIFTVLFLGFPSGLVLYWLTNSIVTILEQWLIFKKAK
ncbi:MAG: membrane protein insertase YidC [Elusimicrobia bacterium]|nr:membrane protein insertase YidC [Elusimicrobiota bacterium]